MRLRLLAFLLPAALLLACSDDTEPAKDMTVDTVSGGDGLVADTTVDGPAADTTVDGPAADTTVDGPATDGPAADQALVDGPSTDSPVKVDASTVDAFATDTTAAVPDAGLSTYALVITEIMPNPSAVSDGKGEWFEVHNPSKVAVNMAGWTIKDNYKDTHTIAAAGGTTIVPAGGYLVLGNNTDSKTNGGLTVGYTYGSSWYLANSNDEIMIYDDKGKLVDAVGYNTKGSWVVTSGASMALKDVTKDNNVAANWCTESTKWTGSAGDTGSPGAKTVCK